MRYILMAFLFGIFFSCTEKININQLLFNKSLTEAYYNGNSFNGEAWSSDNETICIKCKNGKIISVEVFHENGKLAIESSSLTGIGKTFDENGKPVSLQKWKKDYPKLLIAVKRFVEEMYYDESLK